MGEKVIMLGKGTADGIDPSLSDQLQESEGVDYNVSDPAASKLPGRAIHNSGGAAFSSFALLPAVFVSFNGDGTDRIITATNAANNNIVSVDGTTGVATTLASSGFGTSGMLDGTKVGDDLFIASGVSALTNQNVAIRTGGTKIPHGLFGPSGVDFSFAYVAGSLTSSGLQYWVTEYDSVNGIESVGGTTLTATPAAQGVKITWTGEGGLPRNSTADKWRLYRSLDLGSKPIGWLLAEQTFANNTYTDNTTDANLVLNQQYSVVNINDILKDRDVVPPPIQSVATFEGVLCGVDAVNGDLVFAEGGLPHSFPTDYRIKFLYNFGGRGQCCRTLDDGLYVCANNETFRVDYLPNSKDGVFDAAVVWKRIAHYGTPSPNGACVFTGWGGKTVLFIASPANPILINADGVDLAVSNIDWANTVPLSLLQYCRAIDNPDLWRVELYFRTSTTDATAWKVLHFYYDPDRLEHKQGIFPEMAWTGPHLCPGPGVFGRVAGTGQTWTVSRKQDGFLYKEGVGTSDAANLVDGSGTINYRLTTPRIYPAGDDGQVTLRRIYLHKKTAGTGTYSVKVTTFLEEEGGEALTSTIDATVAGNTSMDLNAACKAFEIRIVRDDAAAMPEINKLTVTWDDETKFIKSLPYSPVNG